MPSNSLDLMQTCTERTEVMRQSTSEAKLTSWAARVGEKLLEDVIYANFDDSTKVMKPENDHSTYEAIRLSNDMKVLLISDPTVHKSAAALAVQAGSMHDPRELPGMAHFCEHLIFASGKKSDGEFEKFVGYNGGDINSYTRRDLTVFGFDILPESFLLALQQFANFFTDTEFTEEDIEESVAAINAEFDRAVGIDLERRDRVEASLTSSEHPYHQFDIGNTLSLWTRPKGKCIDLRDEALKFVRHNYSSNLMTLVVIGTQPTEQLATIAEEYFSPIKNNCLKVKSWPKSPYGKEHLKTKVDIVPISDISKLLIIVPVPDYSSIYESGIIQYMAFLVGNDGPGSLIYLLREKNWASKLEPEYKRPGKGFAFFNVHLDLTPSGLKNVNNVVHNCSQYFKMMKVEGPQRWVWEQIQIMQHASFRFMAPESCLTRAQNLSAHMTVYPAHHYVVGKCLVRDYLPAKIREFTDCFTPDNFRIILSDKSNSAVADETEGWFGVQYHYSEIDEAHITKWRNCDLHDELHLPRKNRFIPESFELKRKERKSGRIKPHVILEKSLSSVWFCQDIELKIPSATVILSMRSALPKQSAEYFNYLGLIEKVLHESLLEMASDAKHAGMSYKIEASSIGLTIMVTGFDNKIDDYFEFVLSTLFQFCCTGKIRGLRFQDVKDAYAESLAKWKDLEPYVHGIEFIRRTLNSGLWNPEQLMEAYRDEHVTPNNLMLFGQNFLKRLKLRWFFYGNLTEEEALGMHHKNMVYFDEMNTQPYDQQELEEDMAALRLDDVFSREFSILHQNHMDSCCVLLLQTCQGADVRENALTEVLNVIIKRPMLGALRTEDQFVWTDVYKSKNFLGLQIILQDEKDPVTLERNIENFLGKLEFVLTKLTEKDICRFRAEVASRKQQRWKLPKARSQILFEEIQNGTHNFHRHQQEVTQLQRIRLKDILDFYAETISPSSSTRRKLCVLVASSLSRRDVVQLQNHSTEAMSTEATNSFHPEEKPTPGAADDLSTNIAQRTKDDAISQNTCKVKSGSNASISDSLERKSSENIRAGAEVKGKKKGDPFTSSPTGNQSQPQRPSKYPTRASQRPTTVMLNSKQTASSGRLNQLKNQAESSGPLKSTILKRTTSYSVNRKPSKIRPRYHPQPPRATQSKAGTSLGENLAAAVKIPPSHGKAVNESIQGWAAQIRKNQIVRENSVIVRSITTKVLHQKSTAFPMLQSYLQRADATDEQLLERLFRLHQPPRVASRPNVRSPKPSKTVVTVKATDTRKRQLRKQESKAGIQPKKKSEKSSELRISADSVDFRDYDFDFEAEIRRLKTLKKYLKHQNVTRRAEQQKQSDVSPAVKPLSPFFCEAAGEDQGESSSCVKPPVRPDYNVTYEVQRLKALKQILDTEAAKYSRSSTNNSVPLQPPRQEVKKGLGVSVHEVEMQIQRLKNIKRYFDGETKDLNLHNIEYTIFVLHDIKIAGAAPRIKNILSSVQKGKSFRNGPSSSLSSSHSVKEYDAKQLSSISTQKKASGRSKVPSHVVVPYKRKSGGQSNQPSRSKAFTTEMKPPRQSMLSSSHYILMKRSSHNRNIPNPQMSVFSQFMNPKLLYPAPTASLDINRNNNVKMKPIFDRTNILLQSRGNTTTGQNQNVSSLMGLNSSQGSGWSRFLSSSDLRRVTSQSSIRPKQFVTGSGQDNRSSLSRSLGRESSFVTYSSYQPRSSSILTPAKWKSEAEAAEAEARINLILNRALAASKSNPGSRQSIFTGKILQSTSSWSSNTFQGEDLRSRPTQLSRSIPKNPVSVQGSLNFSTVDTSRQNSKKRPLTYDLKDPINQSAAQIGPSRLFQSSTSPSGNQAEPQVLRTARGTFAPWPVIPKSFRGSGNDRQPEQDVTTARTDGDEIFMEVKVTDVENALASIESAGTPFISMPNANLTETPESATGLEQLRRTKDGDTPESVISNSPPSPDISEALSSPSCTASRVKTISTSELKESCSEAVSSKEALQQSTIIAGQADRPIVYNEDTRLPPENDHINEITSQKPATTVSLPDAVYCPTVKENVVLEAKDKAELLNILKEEMSLYRRDSVNVDVHLNEIEPEPTDACYNQMEVKLHDSLLQGIDVAQGINFIPHHLSETQTETSTASQPQNQPLLVTVGKTETYPETPMAVPSSREITSCTERTPLLKTTAGKKASDLFNSIAEAFFQIHQHDLAIAVESSKSEKTASNTPSGSGTPELRKWMKEVVSTELRTCMRELARKAMNEEEMNHLRDTQYALQPILYSPPSHVLKAVKTFSGITPNHSSTKDKMENQPSGTPVAAARPVDALGEHSSQEETGEEASPDSNSTNSDRSNTDISGTEHPKLANQ